MIKKFNNFNEKKIEYQKQLCSDIWVDNIMIDRIENKLLRIARDFYQYLETSAEVLDIYLTGSLANFNYSTASDLDVHIILDFSKINTDIKLVEDAFDGKKFKWNMMHNITIHGHDVELYVQDINEPHIASGLYSLMNHKWIVIPAYNPPDIDQKLVDDKYDTRVYEIDKLIKISKKDLEPNEAEEYHIKAKNIISKIKKARKDGLSEYGEFSIENLVFKKLRNTGYIEKIIDVTNKFYDMIYIQ